MKQPLKPGTYRYAETVEKDLEWWISVPGNPRQRDTQRHLSRAWHLWTPDPTHNHVVAGRTPDGEYTKIDGHSRCEQWEQGRLPPPMKLVVTVYDCADTEAVVKLYMCHDLLNAAESPSDQCTGAMRELNLHFQSPVLVRGLFSGAIKQLYQKFGNWNKETTRDPEFTYKCVKYFQTELLLLDATKIQRNDYPMGIFMAALVTFMRRGILATPFWTAYSRDEGCKTLQGMDGAHALRLAVQRQRARSHLTSDVQDSLMGKAINACEAYIKGQEYSTRGSLKSMRGDRLQDYLKRSQRRRPIIDRQSEPPDD